MEDNSQPDIREESIDKASQHEAFGRLLRFWRSVSGLSQAQLSHQLSTSPRHISFLETGRSQPSRAMVERLVKELCLSEREGNVLLLAAGLTPNESAVGLGGSEGRLLRRQIKLLLAKHEPYPAFVANNVGDIVMCNRAWLAMMSRVLPANKRADINVYHLYFSEEGLRDLIGNWDELSCVLLLQVKEQQLLTGDEKLNELMQWLEAYPGIPQDWAQRAKSIRFASGYELAVQFDGREYSMDTVITGIDPMRMAMVSQLKLHSFYPSAEHTERWWQWNSEQPESMELAHPLLYSEQI